MFDSLKKHFQQVLPFTKEELNAVDKYFTECIFAKKAMLLEAPDPCKYLFLSLKVVCVISIPRTTAMKKPVTFHLKTNGQPLL